MRIFFVRSSENDSGSEMDTVKVAFKSQLRCRMRLKYPKSISCQWLSATIIGILVLLSLWESSRRISEGAFKLMWEDKSSKCVHLGRDQARLVDFAE
ncbi:hypothetical protein TNIN_267151 [Trichonephila inaurata madagascariensis]|uniref:Uncharacterized protein n=1 Tax=Trichonephila inaurata madagascariensis TaxID=2747483 RepID=A0A8X6IFI4_9ARAC|nr:hypothetical protein TNIN_267151 [Trichonephila inaurata madagascariensis]